MNKRLSDLMSALKTSGAITVAAGFVVAMGLMDISRSLIGGLVGSLLDKINVQNEGGTFRLDLGTMLLAALSAGLALAVVFLLLGRTEGGERKSA